MKELGKKYNQIAVSFIRNNYMYFIYSSTPPPKQRMINLNLNMLGKGSAMGKSSIWGEQGKRVSKKTKTYAYLRNW